MFIVYVVYADVFYILLLVLFDTKIICSYYLCLKDIIIILFSIPFPNLIILVIEYLFRCATVMYQSLAMITEISDIGGRINS